MVDGLSIGKEYEFFYDRLFKDDEDAIEKKKQTG